MVLVVCIGGGLNGAGVVDRWRVKWCIGGGLWLGAGGVHRWRVKWCWWCA